MATSNWHALQLKPPFVEEVNSVIDGIQNVLDEVTSLLNTVKQILEVARAVLILSSADPLELIIKQLLDEIDRLLENISEKTTINAIIIPIHKQAFGVGNEVDFSNLGGPTFGQMVADSAFVGSAVQYQGTSTIDLAQFINSAPYAIGGNKGFYSTLVESLQDTGDINRPLFDETFAVTGGCALLGTRSFADLNKILNLLLALLKLGDRTDPLRNAFRPPQNLRARVIPITTVAANPGRIGVVLDWEKPQLRINFPLYNEEEALIDEILVIRSTDKTLREKFSWSEVFATDVTNDLNDLPVTASGRTKVIKRIRNDGFSGSYVDDDPNLAEDSVYYYTLAFRYKLNDQYLRINFFSNAVRVQFTRPLVTATSEPPDWFSSPSLVEIFPALEEIVGAIRLILAELRTKSFSGPTILDQVIEAIDSLVKRGELANAILQEILELLRVLSNTDVGGIYATTITTNSGGMKAWTSELARRLSNKADASRPPYDDPRDLVTGIIMVAGAPITLGDINTTIPFNAQILALEKLFELIFGSGKSNPVLDAIDAVDNPSGNTTKPAFGAGMQPSRVPAATVASTPPVTFNAQMQPTKTIC